MKANQSNKSINEAAIEWHKIKYYNSIIVDRWKTKRTRLEEPYSNEQYKGRKNNRTLLLLNDLSWSISLLHCYYILMIGALMAAFVGLMIEFSFKFD